MIPRDILKEIVDGKVSEEEAEGILHEILDSDYVQSLESMLSLSYTEYKAYVHGVPFTELAEWRYHGWPNRCAVCGKEIDVENSGWWAGGDDTDGPSFLRHIACL